MVASCPDVMAPERCQCQVQAWAVVQRNRQTRGRASMEVRSIRWVGIPTRNYPAMSTFLRDVLALRVNFEEPTTTEFSTSEGDEI